jgi:hypothetical protein
MNRLDVSLTLADSEEEKVFLGVRITELAGECSVAFY